MNFQQQQALANAQAMQRNAGAAGGMTPQQQQQLAMAQQMAGQYGGGNYSIEPKTDIFYLVLHFISNL